MKFEKRQVWVDKKNQRAIEWMKNNIMPSFKISKKTKITSIGSCFAREIKEWLIKNKFNYLIREKYNDKWQAKNIFKGDVVLTNEHSSVAWERVYNTFTLKQIADYSFGGMKEQERLMNIEINGNKYVTDIIRNRMVYLDRASAVNDIYNHAECSRRLLEEIDVIMITLGTTEVWESEDRGLVAGSNQFKYYSLPEDFRFKVSGYKENLENLNYFYHLLKAHNPELKFIITVSPVHLLSTMRKDVDVITASCESKSILRTVVGEFSRNRDVYYFPSYEIATIVSNLDMINVYPDSHHVSREVVNGIMEIFNECYVE